MTERDRAGAVVIGATILTGVLVTVFLLRFRPALTVLGNVARPAVAAAGVVLTAWAAGWVAITVARRLARRWQPAAEAEGAAPIDLSDALLIGYAAFGTVVGLVAWLGVGLDAVVANLLIVGGGAGVFIAWRERAVWWKPSLSGPTAAILAIPILFGIIGAITPVNSPDELVYKLGVPRGYQLHGQMVEMPLNANSYLVLALHLTDLAALIAGGGMAAKLARFALFLASLAAVHRVARRLAPQLPAAVTGVIAYTPALMLIAGWCWSEWPVLGLLLVAFEHYQRWLERRSADHAATMFLALGAALACKYSALPWLFAVSILLLYRHRQEKRFLAAGSAITIFSGGFFYLRNLIWTGSPLAPLLLPDAPAVANYRGGAWYSGWTDFLRGIDLFDRNVVDESMGPLLLVAFAAGLFALRSGRGAIRDLAFIGALQMPILLTFAPGSRNMLNGAVPLAMAGTAIVAGAWLAAPRLLRVGSVIVAAVAALAQTSLVLFALESYDLGAYLAGRETAAQYILRIRDFSRPYAWINTLTPPSSRVLLLAENRPFYLNRRFIAAGNHDGMRVARWLAR
ncbi:MAG TPA: hypothetical protein VFL80_13400, partial [Thermoanaerobaculia bacterium]|nr:hypothetical protein [Thermoanaerobaculia bacterium]